MTAVSLLGTGLLGTAIAQRLLDRGLDVHVWNRNASRLGPLVDQGATPILDLHDAALNRDAVITVLRDGNVTAEVLRSLGPLAQATVIPMGTMGVRESQNLAAEVIRQGGDYLEAQFWEAVPRH